VWQSVLWDAKCPTWCTCAVHCFAVLSSSLSLLLLFLLLLSTHSLHVFPRACVRVRTLAHSPHMHMHMHMPSPSSLHPRSW
jgi:hypothetical protein